MLCKMDFWLVCKVVALHLDNRTAKAYLCNQSGTVSICSRLACHIFNLADMHGFILLPAYISTHLNVEADYTSQGRLVPEGHLLSHIVEMRQYVNLGQLE